MENIQLVMMMEGGEEKEEEEREGEREGASTHHAWRPSPVVPSHTQQP